MNIRASSRFQILRLVFTLLGLLALTTSTGLGAVPAQTGDPVSLVRLDLQTPSDLERFAATGLPVYAQMQTPQGDSYLILPVTDEQQRLLSSLGFQLKVLDRDAGDPGSSYYLLYTRSPEAIRRSSLNAAILEQDEQMALVKVISGQAVRLSALGVEIVLLSLHPLVADAHQKMTMPEQINPDPVIQGMIDQVDQVTVYNYAAGLSGESPITIGGEQYTLATRYTYTTMPIEKATQFTYEHFQGIGLPVSYHYYNLSGNKRNVIAEQVGVSQPERIFLITAHLDSLAYGDPEILAPGADDNASGSVGVLIAADILSQYAFDCTIRYALFTGEEQGLVGSEAYAAYVNSLGEDIEGVLNLDMIAYNTLNSAPAIELHTRPGNQADLAIANLFSDVVDTYNLNLTPEIVQSGIRASDHASFWDFGYPAILGIEDYTGDFNPYYHTTSDQVERLDTGYFTNYVKAAVGAMAHLGCLPNQGTLLGEVFNAQTSDPIPGTEIIAERSVGHDYLTQTDLNGNYQLLLSSGTYSVTAKADGYAPYVTSGVQIASGITSKLDIQLQPCSILGPDFTISPQDPLTGNPVTFSGIVDPSSTEPVTFEWDFGDGHTGSGKVVAHTYIVSDTYMVTMTATNYAGSINASYPVIVRYPLVDIDTTVFFPLLRLDTPLRACHEI